MKIQKRIISLLLVIGMFLTLLTGCGGSGQTAENEADTFLGNGRSVLRIVSGSENAELEPILTKFAEQENVRIEMTYQGSLDIMRLLGEEEIPYDAVWPASSLWLTVGDTEHRVKHAESISVTPVVFGIRQSLAENLGFVGREVSVSDLLATIQGGQLSFCMTSATQSNSGASAYIGFLYALLGNPEVITEQDLQDENLKTQIRELLLGFGIEARIVRRKKYFVVYIKEGAGISDFLNVTEAHVALMEFENSRVVRDVRNTVNRRVNCETANIAKTVNAAARQVEDILWLQQRYGLENLPEGLRQMAQVRLEHPDAPLKELGAYLDPPVGKSGVNHRLRKLCELAESIRS